jgi:hypothetical protein
MEKLRRGWRIFKVGSWEYWFPRLVWWRLRFVWWAIWPAILIGFCVLTFLVMPYSLVVYFFGESTSTPVWDWWTALISTLASVFLAIAVGVVLLRIQSSLTSRDEEHEMENLLHSELVRVLDKLQVNLPEREEPYPPKREIPASELKPEWHETHFKFNYFDTQFLERAVESRMLPYAEETEARKLVGQLHEYNQQMAHLRSLSVNATALQEGESRYQEQARIVLLLEKRVTKQARHIIRIVWNREKRNENGW